MAAHEHRPLHSGFHNVRPEHADKPEYAPGQRELPPAFQGGGHDAAEAADGR